MKFIKYLFLVVVFLRFVACSSLAAPPISIPAPTATGISVSTDGDGTTYVVGTPGAVDANATVEIVVEDGTASLYLPFLISTAYAETAFCTVQAESDGSFVCSGTADPGDTLCIRQTNSLGGISSCADVVVPENAYAHKFLEFVDIYLDATNSITYLLGRDLDGNYELKVYDNDLEELTTTFDLPTLINDATTNASAIALTSVTAKDDVIMVSDHANDKLYTFSLSSGTLTAVTSDICSSGGSPSYVRVDTPDAQGSAVTDYLLVCEDTSNLYLQKNLLGTHSVIQSETVALDIVSYLGISSPGREEWFLLVELDNQVTQRILITDGVQIILNVDQLNLSGGLYNSYSSGFSNVTTALIERLPLFAQTTSLASILDSDAQSQQTLILDSGVDAIDVVCKQRELCEDLLVIGNDNKIYKISPDQSLQFSSATSMSVIDPTRLLVDENENKLLIFDLEGQAIIWEDISQF